jgi:hypothetical protein
VAATLNKLVGLCYQAKLTSNDIGAVSSGPLVLVSASDSTSIASSSSFILGTCAGIPLVCGTPLVAVVPAAAPVPARFFPALAFVRAPLRTGTGGAFLEPLAIPGVSGGMEASCLPSSSASSLDGEEWILLLLLRDAFGISLKPDEERERDRLLRAGPDTINEKKGGKQLAGVTE